eukprot:Skav219220  [mRNA]  locus=scaffold1015:81887:94707:+ [translate_table: standard]
MARQLMSLPFKDFQDRILKDRNPAATSTGHRHLLHGDGADAEKGLLGPEFTAKGEPDACDPSPQRLFDRRFRRNLTVLPPATTESRAVLRASNHGLPPLPQKAQHAAGEFVLRQPSGCLLTLQLQRCHVGYNSCVKLASLLESDAAKNLRVLNLNGIALSLAVQVHLAASIRLLDIIVLATLSAGPLAKTAVALTLAQGCLQNVADGTPSMQMLSPR